MPNYCSYFIKAKGPDKDLMSLQNLFMVDYAYTDIRDFMNLSFISRNTPEKKKIYDMIEEKCSVLQHKTLSEKEMKDFTENLIKSIEKDEDIKTSDEWPPFKSMLEDLGRYRIEEGYINPPEKEHLFRISDSYYQKTSDALYIDGTCAWSVSACMLPGYLSYYNDYVKKMEKDNIADETAKGTTLSHWAQKHPETEFEVISYEEGCAFFEHYFFRDGVMETAESDDMDRLYIEDMDDLEEMLNDSTLSYDRRKRCEDYMEHCRTVMKELPHEKESLFPVFMSLGEPDYIEIPDDFNESGNYEPLFSI